MPEGILSICAVPERPSRAALLVSGTSIIWCRQRRRCQYNRAASNGQEWNAPTEVKHQAHCWALRDRALARKHPSDRSALRTARHGGYAMYLDRCRPYLENCIVDASIFVAIVSSKMTT